MDQAILNRARNDKFILVLDIPPALKQNNSFYSIFQKKINSDSIQLTVYGSPVPAIAVPDIIVPFAGQSPSVSSHSRPAYPVFTTTFVIDNGYINYWVLLNWLNVFNDMRTGASPLHNLSNIRSNDIPAYNLQQVLSNFSLYALDEYNNRIMQFEYSKAFIVGLSEINYNYRGGEEIVCNAQFKYQQMLPNMLKDVSSIDDC